MSCFTHSRIDMGTTILANGKGHFGPTDRNDQTGHSGPPSKLVPNIPVGPNRNGPFHLMNQPKFPDFWVEWKAPYVKPIHCIPFCFSIEEASINYRTVFLGNKFWSEYF